MLSKTRLQQAEHQWRHFVFDSRFTRILFWSGAVIFLAGIVTPKPVSAFLMERLFGFWFGGNFLFFGSTYLLTTLDFIVRRDWISMALMSVVAAFFCFIGCHVLLWASRL